MSRPKSYHQGFVLPMAIFASAMAILMTWNQHTLKVDSPIFAAEAQARRWAETDAKARRCLPSTVDVEISAQGFGPVTGNGPYFATLRCNQHPQIYVRWLAILAGPWIVLTLLARLGFRSR
jgi:hypothetical protein